MNVNREAECNNFTPASYQVQETEVSRQEETRKSQFKTWTEMNAEILFQLMGNSERSRRRIKSLHRRNKKRKKQEDNHSQTMTDFLMGCNQELFDPTHGANVPAVPNAPTSFELRGHNAESAPLPVDLIKRFYHNDSYHHLNAFSGGQENVAKGANDKDSQKSVEGERIQPYKGMLAGLQRRNHNMFDVTNNSAKSPFFASIAQTTSELNATTNNIRVDASTGTSISVDLTATPTRPGELNNERAPHSAGSLQNFSEFLPTLSSRDKQVLKNILR